MKRIQISAAPGDPSTIWVSDSGKQYRTKKEAMADKGTEINSNDYEIKTNWWTRNWKTVTISAGVVIVLAATAWALIHYKVIKL